MKNNVYLFIISLFMVSAGIVQGSQAQRFFSMTEEFQIGSFQNYRNIQQQLRFSYGFEVRIARILEEVFANGRSPSIDDIKFKIFEMFPNINEYLSLSAQQTGLPCDVSNGSLENIVLRVRRDLKKQNDRAGNEMMNRTINKEINKAINEARDRAVVSVFSNTLQNQESSSHGEVLLTPPTQVTSAFDIALVTRLLRNLNL